MADTHDIQAWLNGDRLRSKRFREQYPLLVLILCLLFGLGYFFGTVENKRDFVKNTANKLIPDKEIKVIDFKTELKREQEQTEAVEAEVLLICSLSTYFETVWEYVQ